MDRWLWSVRLFKTRTLAAEACDAGKVCINGQPAKPAREVHAGEVVTLVMTGLTRTVRVLAPLESRVGAALVPQYLEDLTPPSEYARAREEALAPQGYRPPGAGRPTKRDRRLLQSYFGEDE
jgi:ribosome-associated heat shock protein Hsp15